MRLNAGARFIDQRGADDPGLVEREQLALPVALIAAAGEAVAVGGGRLVALVRWIA